ncbi:MAG: hypothetical protein ABSA76_05285, partial [Bacteroidales bacterium]
SYLECMEHLKQLHLSHHRFKKYPNLIVGMVITSPEQLWVSDIKYVRTLEGFSYLSTKSQRSSADMEQDTARATDTGC